MRLLSMRVALVVEQHVERNHQGHHYIDDLQRYHLEQHYQRLLHEGCAVGAAAPFAMFGLLHLLDFLFYVVAELAESLYGLHVFGHYLEAEGLFHYHHDVHEVEAIHADVFFQACFGFDFLFVKLQLLSSLSMSNAVRQR